MNLQGKTAIVTGASSGIGAAFSQALITKGATVYGLARSEDKLQRIRDEFGSSFIPVKMDITNHKAIESWVDKTFSGDQSPDVLVNNAGLGYFGNVDELSVEEWDTMINTNLSGTFYLTRQIVPLMKEYDPVCHIINIASIAGKLGNPQISGYNASKFGVSGFSEALFKELRYDGIKVTCLYPGSIATNFFDNAERGAHSNMMQPEDMATVLTNVLETPDNFLISDMTMRPLNPKRPEDE
ncbi:SDR family NAD(P)-dependent oxidoreductase [Aliifodinibius sp. S!AR15-10]|uniref:SDR family oxidoreductase n=1 Tax=Aliifodinibius sp. S!AR15-10 TaxID=2950437 RepID=UPI0028674A53|nr:SDR family NAD(P)-dependent oxidoreductase [Aliifodinibius sp. S!AR15-10]MDR8392178.1 SDR family NAD(P)-dependent oxidoreductase [Aliifodinibius sp. S!AR15-10]